MMKITGLSHLFKWENLHNWWLTKYFFAPMYVSVCACACVHVCVSDVTLDILPEQHRQRGLVVDDHVRTGVLVQRHVGDAQVFLVRHHQRSETTNKH